MPDAALPAAERHAARSAPGPAPAVRARPAPPTATGPALALVMALELAARITGIEALRLAGWAAAGAVVVLARPALGRREAYLLSVAGLLALGLVTLHPAPRPVLAGALDQASFLMAFILLLGLLYEAAATSPAVAEVGRYLTRQPPGRRYYALNAGTALMAVLFNIGVVSFLVPLIQRGIESATPGDALNPIRERRQVTALLRGFAWCVVWSPTAMAPLAVMELIPGIDRSRWFFEGLGVFALMLVIGALEDRLRFRAYRPRGPRVAAAFPWRAALRFGAACLWLLLLAGAAVELTGDTAVFGLMVACPLLMLGWIGVQNGPGRDGLAETRARVARIFRTDLPKSAPVAVTLAASGFIGRAAAGLVPAEALAAGLHLEALPDFLLLSALPPLIWGMSLLGLSPIMTAVFFGSLFGGLATLPADATLIGLAISCGWGLSMTFSPFATVVLLIDRVSGLPPRRTTFGWNTAFSLIAMAVLVPVFALLTRGA